jgi:uncharacterized membrane protein
MISISTKHIRWCVGIAILVHFSVIFLLGLSRYWGYMSSINDIGMYDQAVWGGVHGEPFLNTIGFNQQTNWLGQHFNPILILFTPLYAIVPSATWLTFAQALALSLAGLPIFLLASRVFTSEKVGLLWALVYLVNPFILNAAAWDFHPITLVVPFVAMSMLSIESKNFRVLLLSCLVILSCKEHLGIMVIGFGFLWGIKNNRWKSAILLILIGIIHFILVLMVIMPALSPTGEHIMLNKGIGQKGRYTWLGSSPKEALQTIFTRPFYILKKVILEMGGAGYLLLILGTFLAVPLAAPEFLLPGLADLATNMLSSVSMPRSPFAYHSVSLVPVLAVAAIYGTERISRWSKKLSAKELTGFLLIANIILCYSLAPLPLPGAKNHWKPLHFLNLPDPTVSTIRFIVGKKASISAQANIGGHFSQRLEIYRFPNKVGEVDAIILRLESPTTNINNLPDQLKKPRGFMLQMLDSHLQMDRTQYISSIEHLLAHKEYKILLWNDPWLVMGKGREGQQSTQVREVKNKLEQLRKLWKTQFKLQL